MLAMSINGCPIGYNYCASDIEAEEDVGVAHSERDVGIRFTVVYLFTKWYSDKS